MDLSISAFYYCVYSITSPLTDNTWGPQKEKLKMLIEPENQINTSHLLPKSLRKKYSVKDHSGCILMYYKKFCLGMKKEIKKCVYKGRLLQKRICVRSLRNLLHPAICPQVSKISLNGQFIYFTAFVYWNGNCWTCPCLPAYRILCSFFSVLPLAFITILTIP